jgi:ribosomal protein L34E
MSWEKAHATKCTAVVVTLVIIFFEQPVGGHERCSIGASELEGIQRQRRNDLGRISPQYSKKVHLVKHKT